MRSRILGTLGYLLFLFVIVEIALQGFYYVTAGDFLFVRVGVPVFAENEWSGIGNRRNLAYEHHTNEIDAAYYTNDQGFRIPEGRGDYPKTPAPGTRRVMLLGPSFAYGWGVDYEDTYAHQLEQMLAEAGWAGDERVEIINAGVPSLKLASQLPWFVNEGAKYRPDLVVQFIYGTTAVKNDPNTGQHVEDGYLVSTQVSRGTKIRAVMKKFATVFYGWIVYTKIDQALAGSDEPAEVEGAGREMRLRSDFDLDDPDVQESLDLYHRLRDEVEKAGADLVLVYFPLSYAVHVEDQSRWRHLGVLDIAAQREFDVAFCGHLTEVEKIPCLDITDDLQRAAETGDERLYYWLDVHWTALGNRVAARATAERMLEWR